VHLRLITAALTLAAGFTFAEAQTQTPPPAGGAAAGFAAAVAAADPVKGEASARKCGVCHTFEQGGAAKVGPNLWNIVNRPIAALPDYKYSPAMVAYSEGGAKTWTYDELSAYLENPKAHIPGNKMAFPGLKKEDERANVIAYLRTLSDAPASF
jgi:cytochrome c